jgi:hypothetical protein
VAEVALVKGDIANEYVQIAYVDSMVLPKPDRESSRYMREDLRKKARSLGADAVIRVKMLSRKKEGFVNDPTTPFCSFRQGESEDYFLRGVAVKYVCPQEVGDTPDEIKDEQPATKKKRRQGRLPSFSLDSPQFIHPAVPTP